MQAHRFDSMPAAGRSLRIGTSVWPVVLPNIRDARLHTAAVVITLHVLGQVAFGFAVSVPQIASAIVASALVEVVITARRHHRLVWPASAMLTGSGVGLIMRVDGTAPGDHWTWHRWWWFSAIAVLALSTKYVVRFRGSHVFNPSNVALVAVFVVLGSGRVEPLDFTWRPVGPALVIAYAAIIGGGTLITRRLGLLAMAVAFWLTFATGLAVLSTSGHCMLTPIDAFPACGADFWRIVVTSPETLVFVFFMLTDPRTVPVSARDRVLFGAAVAAAATLLIAPQQTEFATKVALLGALTIACAARPLASWLHARYRAPGHGLISAASADERGALLGLATVVGIVAFAATVVAVGAPARTADASPEPVAAAPLPDVGDISSSLQRSPLPDISADDSVGVLDPRYLDPAVQATIVQAISDNLSIEAELMRQRDVDRLGAVDHGTRLSELRDTIETSLADGSTLAIPTYELRTAHLVVARVGRQSGPVLGIEVRGEVAMVRDGSSGLGAAEPWNALVAVRQATDGRWLIVSVRALDP
jgi:Na+-translocating ferredoxin:NAD+ oxidoreductase RnfD subunit